MGRRSGRKRRLIVAGTAVVVLALAALVAWIYGETVIERWCGEQLLAMGNDLLRPEVTFDSLDYVFPATAVLHEVRLIDQGRSVVEAASVRLVFTERPRRGTPLVIEEIELRKPVVRIIQQENGELLGFGRLMDSKVGNARDGGGSTRPSDVLAVRRLGLIDGVFEWHGPGGETMRVDDLTFDLTSRPEARQGWYRVESELLRDVDMRASLDAHLNIDDAILEIERLELEMTVTPERYGTMPPMVQPTLRDNEIRGQLECVVSGTVPLGDAAASAVTAEVRLTDGHATVGDFEFPVELFKMTARLGNLEIDADMLHAKVFGGAVNGTGRLTFSDRFEAQIEFVGGKLRLEQAVRTMVDGEAAFAGAVTIDGRIDGSLADLRNSLIARGRVELEDGFLRNDPVFSGVIERGGGDGDHPRGSDSAEADLEADGRQIRLRKVRLVSDDIAARGEGELRYDGSLNLRFNAGPLERLQSSLGAVGDLLGVVTDAVLKYHVTGTVQEPEFNVRPLGIGASAEKDPPG